MNKTMEVKTAHDKSIPALTGLRFIAALFVLLGHAGHSFMHFTGPLFGGLDYLPKLAAIGMPLFFVLSGFVIHYNYAALISSAPCRGTYNFIVARFARLYPLYLIILFADLFRFGYFENLNNQTMFNALYTALPSYLVLAQSWHYQIVSTHSLVFTFPAATTVTWSISTEWFFYLCFPLLCIALSKFRNTKTLIFAILGLILLAYLSVYFAAQFLPSINAFAVAKYGQIANQTSVDSFVFWLFYLSPYPRLFEFILGSLTSALFIVLRDKPVSKKQVFFGQILTWVAIIGIVLCLVLLFGPTANFTPKIVLSYYFGFAPFIAILIFCCARYPGIISYGLSRPWIILCGEASYSIYLFHIVIVQYIQINDQIAGIQPVICNIWNTLHFLMTLLFVILTTIGLSVITYKIIEIPSRKLLRNLLTLRPLRSRQLVEQLKVT